MGALVVIDMQNDFVTGSLGTPEAQAIVPFVRRKVAQYREAGLPIVFTRDTHGSDYLQTQEGSKLPVPHCIEGTDGWNLVEGLAADSDTVIDKPSFGFAGWSDLADILQDEVEIVGLCTDICVVSNALVMKAQFPEMDVTVDASCCAGVTPASHQAALQTLRACQVNVVNDGSDGSVS